MREMMGGQLSISATTSLRHSQDDSLWGNHVYVSSKFANRLIVLDYDPNNGRRPSGKGHKVRTVLRNCASLWRKPGLTFP